MKKNKTISFKVNIVDYMVIRREAMLNKQKISEFIRGRLL
jgi:hypothetical protein